MGLCKCPKKKVTNQFCFEHRVNVCEHCMVTNHPKCIVQSYLQWLQDSDYNPICTLCQKELQGECVRLVCYHIFHWDCLDHYAQSLPPHTAPAGYTCPSCQQEILPAKNIISPVADTLRNVLSKANWARTVFGLPPLMNNATEEVPILKQNGNYSENKIDSSSIEMNTQPSWPSVPNNNSVRAPSLQMEESYSHVNAMYSSVTIGAGGSPRKLYDTTDNSSLLANMSSVDHDENKYKRRSAIEWLSRWFRSRNVIRGRHDPHWRCKRMVIIIILVLLAFFTVVMVMTRLGRSIAEDDPFLNPMANPQIKVHDQ